MIIAEWVFTWKADEYGKAVRVKARLVARAIFQIAGVYHLEIFAPTRASSWVRFSASTACEFGSALSYLDTQQVLIHPKLEDSVLERELLGIRLVR